MRPRVLSDPVSKPALIVRSATPPLKTYLISRRGKLLCQDTATRVGRTGLRRRAASASACELSDGGRKRRGSAVRLSERSRPATPSSQDLGRVQLAAVSPSPTSIAFYRVAVAGLEGVGKCTVMKQFLHAAHAEEVADSPQGLRKLKLFLIEQFRAVSVINHSVYRKFGDICGM